MNLPSLVMYPNLTFSINADNQRTAKSVHPTVETRDRSCCESMTSSQADVTEHACFGALSQLVSTAFRFRTNFSHVREQFYSCDHSTRYVPVPVILCLLYTGTVQSTEETCLSVLGKCSTGLSLKLSYTHRNIFSVLKQQMAASDDSREQWFEFTRKHNVVDIDETLMEVRFVIHFDEFSQCV
jgi:hypothetical protein